jgi:hypothetical protein
MYRFSQQGWENYNHVFSTFYFRRRNRGGRRHAGATKSKLMGIGRWMQRRLLWMTGYGDVFFKHRNQVYTNDEGINIIDN